MKEIGRAARVLRFRAVEIGASVQGRDLDDPALEPAWEALTALEVTILAYPQAPVLGQERVGELAHALAARARFPRPRVSEQTRAAGPGRPRARSQPARETPFRPLHRRIH